MKKYAVIAILTILLMVPSVFAEESKLIDFSDLVDNDEGNHLETKVDFSDIAGTRYNEDERKGMVTSLFVPKWEVRLSSSSRSVTNDSLSYVKEVSVNTDSTKPEFDGQQVMGIRVHFPEGNYNSHAIIKPPFQIPAYATSSYTQDPDTGEQFTGFGVLKNVGVIKEIKLNVYGMNYPMGLYVVLRDSNEVKSSYFIEYLDFEGWTEMVWRNPNYITDVRNRLIRRDPLYPRSQPSVTLDSFIITRDGMIEGGEFISYIKDVTIVYDKAILDGFNKDINHEETWGILEKREEYRRNFELKRLGDQQVLRYLEDKKMHKGTEDSADGGDAPTE